MESTGRWSRELTDLRSRSYGECRSCGARLPEGKTAYAGYAKDGSPRYVGDCCLEQIEELASYVYWWWEADKRVEPETPLWRYMDLAKFLELLESGTLFFPRADAFDDPFEGASGRADRQEDWDRHYLEFFAAAVRHPPTGGSPPEEHIRAEAERRLRDLKHGIESERRSTFVSCWHAADCESEALWRLYCPPGTGGVAIETTAGRLARALGDPAIEIGRVQYVDFRKSYAGFHDRIFWKRSSLRHEAEVRAVFKQRFTQECCGVARSIDIRALCVSVVPSPFAPAWFPALLASVMKRYDLAIPIDQSELLAQPFF